MDPVYILALTTGLLGGFGHCIGMCGPLVVSYAFSERPSPGDPVIAALVPHLLYNAGRIITYSLIGGVIGMAGSFLSVASGIAGLQNAVALFSGMLMIVMGLNVTGIWGSSQWIEKRVLPVLRLARMVTLFESPLRFGVLGLVLGLLPCGLSYTMFIAAAGTGGFLPGALMAALFGLGTIPALLGFGALVSTISIRTRGMIYRLSGALIIAMGCYYVWKGIRAYADL